MKGSSIAEAAESRPEWETVEAFAAGHPTVAAIRAGGKRIVTAQATRTTNPGVLQSAEDWKTGGR
jgi:hypothetical protein